MFVRKIKEGFVCFCVFFLFLFFYIYVCCVVSLRWPDKFGANLIYEKRRERLYIISAKLSVYESIMAGMLEMVLMPFMQIVGVKSWRRERCKVKRSLAERDIYKHREREREREREINRERESAKVTRKMGKKVYAKVFPCLRVFNFFTEGWRSYMKNNKKN